MKKDAKKMVGLARAKGQQIPTFEDAPLEMLPETMEALRMRMEQLDMDHARAQTPDARRRIEKKMRLLRDEIGKQTKEDSELNAEAKAWWDETERWLSTVPA